LKDVKYSNLQCRRFCAKLVVYVVRFEMVGGQLLLRTSVPCTHCLRTLFNYGIKDVVFSVTGIETLVAAKVVDILQSGHHDTSSAHKNDQLRGGGHTRKNVFYGNRSGRRQTGR